VWVTRDTEPHHQYPFNSLDRKQIAGNSMISPDDVPTGDALRDAIGYEAEAARAAREFLEQEQPSDRLRKFAEAASDLGPNGFMMTPAEPATPTPPDAPPPPPPPNPAGWMGRDDTGDQIAAQEAQWRRNFIAASRQVRPRFHCL